MTIPVRMMVHDAWDEVRFDVSPETTLGELKWNALAVTRVTGNPAAYLLKYRGAELDRALPPAPPGPLTP